MSTVGNVVRGVAQGIDLAGGNTAAASNVEGQFDRQRQQQGEQLKLALAPLSQALQADQTRLALYADPNDPSKPVAGKESEYNATMDRMQQTIGQMRGILGEKPKEPNAVESGVGNILDKLHITTHLKAHVAEARQKSQDAYQAQTQGMTQATAAGAVPFAMTPEGQKLGEEERLRKESQKADWQNFKGPNGDVVSVDLAHQTPPPGYVKAGAESLTPKPPKPPKVLGSETMPYGMQDEETGTTYLPSQLGPNGDAPPAYKEMWKSIKDEQAKKAADAQKKEDEIAQRQARTIAAGFERMGQSEQFQELMAQYRSDLQTYRGLNTAADNSEETVKALETQYAQPGNKSAADNELQNFYTTVVQKGGRKTAAELALTLKIGSFGMNLQQMASKAASGELPDPLRKMLLDGMKAISSEQRSMADTQKPELPEIHAPEGPKTRALKQTAKGGWQPPTDAPAAPQQDGKLLKADGKVIAKSQGGKWVQP